MCFFASASNVAVGTLTGNWVCWLDLTLMDYTFLAVLLQSLDRRTFSDGLIPWNFPERLAQLLARVTLTLPFFGTLYQGRFPHCWVRLPSSVQTGFPPGHHRFRDSSPLKNTPSTALVPVIADQPRASTKVHLFMVVRETLSQALALSVVAPSCTSGQTKTLTVVIGQAPSCDPHLRRSDSVVP